jgi:lipopolysaccharide export LptBFGC system permease protein LptF
LKLLDKYILTLFLKNYVISLTVLIGLYVVMDMVFKFDQIVTVNKTSNGDAISNVITIVKDLWDWYFYQAFLIFTQMSGIIPVVAAAFTLMRLSRFNELTAFIAAGVPMIRLARPIIVSAVLLNGLLVVDQEVILPTMIPKLVRTHDDLHKDVADTSFGIKSMQVDERSLLVAARYHPPTKTTQAYMEDMDVLERNENLETTGHLSASIARWNPDAHHWDLTNGNHVTGLLPGEMPSDETPQAVYDGSVTPDEISLYRGSAFVELLPTSKINALIARPKSYGVAGLYKIKNLRWAQPVMNIVLLLLTIPNVMSFDPKSLKKAASKCLTLLALAMSSVFLCQQIAGHPPLGPVWVAMWPALMSWVPIFLFGPIGVWLMLERLRT